MSLPTISSRRHMGLTVLCVAIASQAGCSTLATRAVPVNRLPHQMRGCCQDDLVPINFAALGQCPPSAHSLGPGDLLGIYVYGVLPPQREEDPSRPFVIHPDRFPSAVYYPPEGRSRAPSMGVPISVEADGNVYLPMIDPIPVSGMTLKELRETIAEAYSSGGLLNKGREVVFATLLKPRVHRVVVIRSDAAAPFPSTMTANQVTFRQSGSAAVVDLPSAENDVLHALAATGGLPGTDAVNRIIILRHDHEGACDTHISQLETHIQSGASCDELLACCDHGFTRISIPLRLCPGEPLPISAEDILLDDGDVVFLEPRDEGVYYTGGLLPSGEFPLPRDHDLDILEAIARATGGVAAPAVGGNGVQNLIRSGAGPGNTLIPPTRAIVIRKLSDGQQVRISIDLKKAMHDAAYRLVIQPEDFILLQFTPEQMACNTVLNWFNWNMTVVPSGFVNTN